MTTTFENQCLILTDVWMQYRESEDMAEFFDYFDLAFPLAFGFDQGLAKATELGQSIITECWVALLNSLGVKEDTGFVSLEDMIGLGIEPEDEQD
jgi:hypothetical protein